MIDVDKSHWQQKPVHCAICDSQRFKVLGYHGGWAHHRGLGIASRIVRCRECGFIYANPTPFPVDFSHYSNPDHYFKSHDVQAKVDVYHGLLKRAEGWQEGKKGRMLDIGCGRGESLVAAKEDGWEAVGLEPSEDFVKFGREELGVDVQQGFLEHTDFPDASFDVIIMNAVLEHLYNPMEVLREARRLLRKGGLIFINVPNEAGLFFKVGRLFYRLCGRSWCLNLSPTFEPYHVAGFSPATLRYAFEKAGFETVWLKTFAVKIATDQMAGRKLKIAQAIENLSRYTNSGSFMDAWARAV